MIKVKLVVRQGLCVRSVKFLSINPSFEPNNCKMPSFISQLELGPARIGHTLDMRTLSAGGWRSVERARQRRVFWLLTAAWLVNVFDLLFTQIAYNQSMLVEMNPMAAMVLPYGPLAMAVYKFVLLIVGTSILWWYRRHLVAEAATWAYAFVCVGLSFWWHHFNEQIIPLWADMNPHIVNTPM